MSDVGDRGHRWRIVRDGETGLAYARSLESAGDIDGAAKVHEELIELGYVIGYYELAWIERERGSLPRSEELLVEYLRRDAEPDDFIEHVAGVLGHWQWDRGAGLGAEALLRRGAAHYPSARVDLARLLRVSQREIEADAVLQEGVTAGEVESFLPFAVVLEMRGQVAEAELLYQQGFALGDAHSAFNLHVLLAELGRSDEASGWLWQAAQAGDEWAVKTLADLDLDLDHD